MPREADPCAAWRKAPRLRRSLLALAFAALAAAAALALYLELRPRPQSVAPPVPQPPVAVQPPGAALPPAEEPPPTLIAVPLPPPALPPPPKLEVPRFELELEAPQPLLAEVEPAEPASGESRPPDEQQGLLDPALPPEENPR